MRDAESFDQAVAAALRTLTAIEAVRHLVSRSGLRVAEYQILSERFNLIVHLRPHPVIARVATGAGALRDAAAWMRRELETATRLAKAHAPAARLAHCFPAAIHRQDGFCISFWKHIAVVAKPFSAHGAGAALRACHAALAGAVTDFPVDLALAETFSLFNAARARTRLPVGTQVQLGEALAVARAALTRIPHRKQVIHGDADWHNVLVGPRGETWIDWEDTHIGPVEWDLASAVASFRSSRDMAGANAFLAGYGPGFDARLLDALVGACLAREILWADECHPSGRRIDADYVLLALKHMTGQAHGRRPCPQRAK